MTPDYNPRRPFTEHNNDIEFLIFVNLNGYLVIKGVSVYHDESCAFILAKKDEQQVMQLEIKACMEKIKRFLIDEINCIKEYQ